MVLSALLAVGFLLFVAGGLYSGFVFLENWQQLTYRPATTAEVAPSSPPLVRVWPAQPTIPFIRPPQERASESGTERPNAQPTAEPLPKWDGKERLNVLLLGIDHRDDEPMDGSRSDTMMVVSVDPTSRSVVMISLPRDLWVSIPGYGEQRINVAHSMGGPQLAMQTVAANFGVRLHHWARIDFRGFERVVDTLGGIQVDVERPIKDDEYPTEDYGVMRVYIAPGPQWMNGQTALQYARSRHSENDFGRARRQQRVLMAVRERAIQAGMIPRAPQLVGEARNAFNTSFGPLDMIKLASLSSEIERERIVSLVFDTNYCWPHVNPDGAEVCIPNRAAIQAAINQAFTRSAAGAAATPATAAQPTATVAQAAVPTRIEVLNGTSRNGLALATAEWLRGKGFEVVAVGSADRADYGESRLLVQPGRETVASGLATALGLPAGAIQAAPTVAGGPDVQLILGQNYQLPAR